MSEKRTNIATWEDNVIIRQEAIAGNENIFSDSNKVWVSGVVEDELKYSHEFFGKKFYKTIVRVARLNGTEDCVPIVVKDSIMLNAIKGKLKGKFVEVGGQFRSYNNVGEDGQIHLDLFLFVTTINIYEREEELKDVRNLNLIYLDGYICKPPIFRTTPLGKEITDLMIAVNRPNNKSDYIPCIAWDKVARNVSILKVGCRIKLYGRIQSREYFKWHSPEAKTGEYRTAYEISIMQLKTVRLEN